MSARPGEDLSSTFSLPTHVDANFTPQQSAEAIVKYFAKISQEYVPIEEDVSSSWMDAQNKLNQGPCEHPYIQEHSHLCPDLTNSVVKLALSGQEQHN